MDNFNLKQYLVENKLTYQEKMKDKAKKLKEENSTSGEIETTAKKVADKIDDVLSPDEINFLKQVYTQSGGKEKIAKAIDTKLEENINEALPKPPASGDFGLSSDEIKLRQIIDKIITKGSVGSMLSIIPAAMAGQPGLAMGLGIAWLLGFLGKDAAWWTKKGGVHYGAQAKYGMKEAETKGKEKEKEEPSKAPKDKSKQGPSSLNEGKVFFGGY